jgi:putative hemolysin
LNIVNLAIAATVPLLVLLVFLSVIEHCVTGMTRLSLKVLAEKEEEEDRSGLLELIARDRRGFLLPLQFGIEIIQVAVAVLLAAVAFDARFSHPVIVALVLVIAVIFTLRQLIPRLLTQHNPERLLLRLLPSFSKIYSALNWLGSPLLGLLQIARTNGEPPESEEEEVSEEEIQAYLGVGEEEGIIEEEESELIQSALEFGTTLVHEVMTPRAEIVAVESSVTLSQLRNVIVASKHSRIPVYQDTLDNILGVIYVRNLLAYLEAGRDDEPITPLIKKAWVVPESRKVADLLKDMQKEAVNMAIVINEYGVVTGLATMEDLVEEIVGEIRDEDQRVATDVSYEGEGNYIVRGAVELPELEEVLDVDLGDPDASTASGLVVSHLGRVPTAGEEILINGIHLEVLSSDRKRIHTMRVRRAERKTAEDELKAETAGKERVRHYSS